MRVIYIEEVCSSIKRSSAFSFPVSFRKVLSYAVKEGKDRMSK
jgi:hypothetical protein